MRFLILLALSLSVLGASCNKVIDDKSAFASSAGESTIVLGACNSTFKKGWDTCLLTRGTPNFPSLKFIVTNKSEWAVSDCEFGLYKTGSTDKEGLVEVDLSGLKEQANKNGFCVLKIEVLEFYPDSNDKTQLHSIYMRGGLFVEMIAKEYNPTPNKDLISFCVKVARTNKGRTLIESCQ